MKFKTIFLALLFVSCSELNKERQNEKLENSEYTKTSSMEPIIINDNILTILENLYKENGTTGVINWVDSNFVPGRKIIREGNPAREGIISNREIVKVNNKFQPTEDFILIPLETQTSKEETFSTWVVPYVDTAFAVRVKSQVKE